MKSKEYEGPDDPCSLYKEKMNQAFWDGRDAGRMLLGAGLNPHVKPPLAAEWERGRLEGTAAVLVRERPSRG